MIELQTFPRLLNFGVRVTGEKWGSPLGSADSIWPFAWAADSRRYTLFERREYKMPDNPRNTLDLRYGINPQRTKAALISGANSTPLVLLSGSPSYINILDALRGWALVRELRRRFDLPAAASFKHVNPAGVGLGGDALDDNYLQTHFLTAESLSPLAIAYLRARHGDRISSYGDFVALSDVVDVSTARVLKNVVSDGVIAPGYEPAALAILKTKRAGRFVVAAIDAGYEPTGPEVRDEFGLMLTQNRDPSEVPDPRASKIVTANTSLDVRAADALLLGAIVARHTQSNAVVVATDRYTTGIGAGQQSRISATKIACEKAEAYLLYDHPKVLGLRFLPEVSRVEKFNTVELFLRFDLLYPEERAVLDTKLIPGFVPLTAEERHLWIGNKRRLCLASDAFIPFRDNIDRAARAGVTHIVQTGGSTRDQEVTAAANQHNIVMLHSGARHFLH